MSGSCAGGTGDLAGTVCDLNGSLCSWDELQTLLDDGDDPPSHSQRWREQGE